jgi:hypothetical protein
MKIGGVKETGNLNRVHNFSIATSISEEPGSGTNGSAVFISVCLSSLTPCTFKS